MTEINKIDLANRPFSKHMSSTADTAISDAKPNNAIEQNVEDPQRSELVKRSANEQVICMDERPKSEFVSKTVKRQVSFQLDQHHGNEKDVSKQSQKGIYHVKRPVVRQCSFQHNQRRRESHTDHDSNQRNESPNRKKSLADMLPELMKKFKTELGCKSFILNARKSVEKKKLSELDKPKERQWMKGSDMHAFYHTWQTSDDHLKDQSVRPKTVKRIKSLPKNFKMTEPEIDDRKPSKKNISEFGIVRECCSHPRMRIPTFHD